MLIFFYCTSFYILKQAKKQLKQPEKQVKVAGRQLKKTRMQLKKTRKQINVQPAVDSSVEVTSIKRGKVLQPVKQKLMIDGECDMRTNETHQGHVHCGVDMSPQNIRQVQEQSGAVTQQCK